MAANLLNVVERIREALEVHHALTPADLVALLPVAEEQILLPRALAFLSGRDEILVDLATHSVHLRERVRQQLLAALSQEGSMTIDQLARRLDLAAAVCCDVLGWLERDGQVGIGEGEVVSLARPRG